MHESAEVHASIVCIHVLVTVPAYLVPHKAHTILLACVYYNNPLIELSCCYVVTAVHPSDALPSRVYRCMVLILPKNSFNKMSRLSVS